MRFLIVLLLLFLSYSLSAQSSERAEKYVLHLTKINGDTIEVTAQWKTNLIDTALITVNRIKNKKRKRIQQLKSPATFPLDINSASFDNKKGILVTYDPAARWGNACLYLFDEIKNQFVEVKGFRELGSIKPVTSKSHQLFYSYISCGCADDCWVSKLFTVKHCKLEILAKLSCDCEKLIATHAKVASANSCEDFNNDKKFETIAKYWKTISKNGL